MKRTLRIPAHGLSSGAIELDVETSRYVIKVHRLALDDEVELFDPSEGLRVRGKLSSDRLPTVVVEATEEPSPVQDQSLPITLIQALGKGDKPEQAVRDATVFGARRVIFVPSERSMAKGTLKMDRLSRVAAQVARQCERGNLPRIEFYTALDDVYSLESLPSARIVCGWGPDAKQLFDSVSCDEVRDGLAVLIGPEGGLSEGEITGASAQGFRLTSLGPLVLRTEVAVGAVLGALRARDLSS